MSAVAAVAERTAMRDVATLDALYQEAARVGFTPGWLPRKLLAIDNKQFDYIAGYGNGKLYLAIWNQSFKEESATVTVG